MLGPTVTAPHLDSTESGSSIFALKQPLPLKTNPAGTTCELCRVQVNLPHTSSFVGALGPLALQDAIPFSIADVDEYISLKPIVCPFAAVRTKYG